MTWVVVIRSGAALCDVAGPFESAAAARAWVEPKNILQRGAVFGEVFPVCSSVDDGAVEREQAQRINLQMRAAVRS